MTCGRSPGDLWITEYTIVSLGRPGYTVGIMEFKNGNVVRGVSRLEPGQPRHVAIHCRSSDLYCDH